MSCSAGTEIVNDGLVFHYDMGNDVKSWKGKPTENISGQTLSGMQGITPTFIGLDDGWKKYSLTGTWNAGTYPFAMRINGSTFTGGVAYSTQIKIKTNVMNKFATFGSLSYVNDPNMVSGGIHTIESLGKDSTGNEIFLTKKQGFIYSTGYANPTTTQSGYIGSRPISDGTIFDPNTDFVWVKDIQVEEGEFCTPYVNGTRSNTESILDLTKNNTITANSLTYNSDGSFEFDGSSDYIYQNFSIPAGENGNSRTWDVWFKPYITQTYAGLFGRKVGAGCSEYCNGGIYIYGNGTVNANWYDNSSYQHLSSNVVPEVGVWCNATVTWDSSDLKFRVYINGELKNTSAVTNNNYGSGYGIIDIGFNSKAEFGGGGTGPHRFNGKIGDIKFYYDKALSPSEVKQNFNALRKRYNI